MNSTHISQQIGEPNGAPPRRLPCSLGGFTRECLRQGVLKRHMSTMQSVVRNRVSTSLVSIALLACSTAWLVAACAYYATGASKADWSATPLFWMLTVMVSPAICFASGMILMGAVKHAPFSRLERCALMAGLWPVTLGTVLAAFAVKALFSMSGVGL